MGSLDAGIVLVAAGDAIPVPGRGDQVYPFRAHSEYLYLTDRERPGGVLAFDPDEGWVEFVAPVTAEELLWTGLDGDAEGVPDGTRPLDELEAFVGGRAPRRLGVTPEPDAGLRDALIRVRRPKDDVELERMRAATEATGRRELVRLLEPGRTERELQVALEAVPAKARTSPPSRRSSPRATTPPSSTSRRRPARFATAICCSSTRAPRFAATSATSPGPTP